MSKIQLSVVAGFVLLFVSLFFANTTPPAKVNDKNVVVNQQPENGTPIEQLLANASLALSKEKKQKYNLLETSFHKETEINKKSNALDSLIYFWRQENKPSIMAYYTEQKANITQTAELWTQAANRYYSSTHFVKENEKMLMYDCAIRCYTKALEKTPNDLNLQTALGICYVEGSKNPMQGITLLKNVLVKDSNNINAHMNLGMFSVKSGQYEKAIDRFKKVLSIDGNRVEVYLYLADVYEQMGNKAEAIKYYEQYKSSVSDPTIQSEINNHINQLKNS